MIRTSKGSFNDSSPHFPTTLATSALIYATVSCILFSRCLNPAALIPLPSKKSGGQNTIHTGAVDKVRCKFACDLIATINAKGSSQQAQPIQARNEATV